MSSRRLTQVVRGQHAVDGAGVSLRRVLGYRTIKDFDPFLMLDGFDSKDSQDYIKGFPWHPHRGIETVTYLLKGEIEHGDSLGNKGVIDDLQCQWMTAGSGIIHLFEQSFLYPTIGRSFLIPGRSNRFGLNSDLGVTVHRLTNPPDGYITELRPTSGSLGFFYRF